MARNSLHLSCMRRIESESSFSIIRWFTPNWFAVTMGTGILALALNQFPAQFSLPFSLPFLDLHRAGAVLWLANSALFVLFSGLYAARWVLFPKEAARIFAHPVMSMFFGTIPMGLATIANGFVAFGVPLIGPQAVEAALVLWWIDAGLALACGILIPYFMITRQEHSLERMTAVWLLPVVAAEVAAASAGVILPALPDPASALPMLILAYVLWAFSVPLALAMLALLLLRLVVHNLPQREMAASLWLALGPLGTGVLGLCLLGRAAPAIFEAAALPGAGEAAKGLGFFGAVVLWGYGLWWFLFAILATVRYLRKGMTFNLGWWGYTFPLGVYALATRALAEETHLTFFGIASALMITALAFIWMIVAFQTLKGALDRSLFHAHSPAVSEAVLAVEA